MSEKELLDAVQSLVERGTIAILAVRTAEGEVALRPIGGH
jgi:general stress protein 26